MRTAAILGRRHGGKKLELLNDPGAKISETIEQFKEFQRERTNETFEHLELWYSDAGRTKVLKGLLTKKAAKAKADASAKAEAEAKAKADKAAKAKAEAGGKEKSGEAEKAKGDLDAGEKTKSGEGEKAKADASAKA